MFVCCLAWSSHGFWEPSWYIYLNHRMLSVWRNFVMAWLTLILYNNELHKSSCYFNHEFILRVPLLHIGTIVLTDLPKSGYALAHPAPRWTIPLWLCPNHEWFAWTLSTSALCMQLLLLACCFESASAHLYTTMYYYTTQHTVYVLYSTIQTK